MQTRKIGSLQVSSIGLGCMNMSWGYGSADDKDSVKLLNRALDIGYTFLDTATVYGSGHNERLIHQAVGHRRNEYTLASKCGLSSDGIDGRPDTLLAQCDASLEKLGVDAIDLYYLHRVDPKVPIEESVGALAKLVSAGKIREIGLSEVCEDNLRRACRTHPIAALQSEYSLWSRTPERAVLKACRELGVTLVPFSPLARQFLTGKAVDCSRLPEDDLRCTIARPRFEPEAFAQNSKLLVPYAEIARQNGCTMAQLALAWLLTIEDGSLVPIPGTKHIDYLEENAGADQYRLDAETVAALNALINDSTVTGNRYEDARMAEADSERD